MALPIEPSDAWKPIGSESPTFYLLWMLASHVGLPYFVLSSTGPLVQAWLSFQDTSDRVYRLYALSNAGSLFALLSYPFRFEVGSQQMSVEVSAEQQKLKEQHAGRPHRRRAAEPRQHALTDNRLDLKDKKCAQQRGRGEPKHGSTASSLTSIGGGRDMIGL